MTIKSIKNVCQDIIDDATERIHDNIDPEYNKGAKAAAFEIIEFIKLGEKK